MTLNIDTPTRVPNSTLQQTSSPDITTVSNILYYRTSGTTQHALLSWRKRARRHLYKLSISNHDLVKIRPRLFQFLLLSRPTLTPEDVYYKQSESFLFTDCDFLEYRRIISCQSFHAIRFVQVQHYHCLCHQETHSDAR